MARNKSSFDHKGYRDSKNKARKGKNEVTVVGGLLSLATGNPLPLIAGFFVDEERRDSASKSAGKNFRKQKYGK